MKSWKGCKVCEKPPNSDFDPFSFCSLFFGFLPLEKFARFPLYIGPYPSLFLSVFFLFFFLSPSCFPPFLFSLSEVFPGLQTVLFFFSFPLFSPTEECFGNRERPLDQDRKSNRGEGTDKEEGGGKKGKSRREKENYHLNYHQASVIRKCDSSSCIECLLSQPRHPRQASRQAPSRAVFR